MSTFVLKIIAMITMTIDHTGYIIFGGFSYFNYIGRFAFPIFAFQIAQGYIHTKNFKKYLSRLLIFSIISQIPFFLFNNIVRNNFVSISQLPSSLYTSITTGNFPLNIFFTLTIGLIAIMVFDKIKYKSIGILFGIGLAFLAEYLKTDYGFYGVSIIFLFYIFREHKMWMSLSFILATIINYAKSIYNLYPFYLEGYDISSYVTRYIILCLCTIFPLIFISLYNGKKGTNTKKLLYFFYPIHLLLIYGISLFIR